MQSYIFRQTNNLLKLCSSISRSNNLKVVPLPANKFKSVDDVESYNAKLSNMIDKPFLFYLAKNRLENDKNLCFVVNYPVPKIPKSYFENL